MLYASKDTRALCPSCGDHLFTFNKDVYKGDRAQIADVYPDRGQAPFFMYEKLVCKVCGSEVPVGSIKLDQPTEEEEPFKTWCDYCGTVIKESTTNIADLYNEMCDDCAEKEDP